MDHIARSPKDIGNALREARKTAGLTQSTLADQAGIWPRTISSIETNAASARLDTLFALCAALQLEIKITPRTKGDAISLTDIF